MGKMSELHVQMQDEIINAIYKSEQEETPILETLVFLEKRRKPLEDALALIKQFKDDHINTIASEASEYPDGYNGFLIEYRNGGRTFDFKNIPEWQELEKAKKECEEKYKHVFMSKEKGLLTASEDGEELILPEISYRKSSIILKEKRK